jgi:hypothetical protein
MAVSTISQAGLDAPISLTSPTLTSPTLNSPTLTNPTISGAVLSSMASSVITSGTAVASTSGTSIQFASIPSWVKRITVMFTGVSSSGTSLIQIQAGTGGTPTYTTSGYISGGSNGNSTTVVTQTSGLNVDNIGNAAFTRTGSGTLTNLTGNTWTWAFACTTSNGPSFGAGSIALGAALTAVRITTVNGTDTFDAGSINILYE